MCNFNVGSNQIRIVGTNKMTFLTEKQLKELASICSNIKKIAYKEYSLFQFKCMVCIWLNNCETRKRLNVS
jgi:hypothetical protein